MNAYEERLERRRSRGTRTGVKPVNKKKPPVAMPGASMALERQAKHEIRRRFRIA